MSVARFFHVSLLVAFFGGCATEVEHYKPVEFMNPVTHVVTKCDQPVSTWITKTDAKANLSLAYDAKAKIDRALADVGSTGKLGFDLSAVKEQVRTISQQNFDYMSFLYPFCKANAEGKLGDADYAKIMKDLLDRFLKENAVFIQFNRIANMSGSGCAGGKRVYRNLVEDLLTFSEPVKDYQAQAFTSDAGGTQTAEIWYVVDNKKVTPISESASLPLKGTRQVVRIPVNGTSARIFYRIEQRPDSSDNEWGLSFVSTLPIGSIRAKVILPPGKTVSGLNKDYAPENNGLRGCSFTPGAVPALECTRVEGTTPNVPVLVVWNWDVFEGC